MRVFIILHTPGSRPHDIGPLNFISLDVKYQSLPVELASYGYLMVIDMFFELLPPRNEYRSFTRL